MGLLGGEKLIVGYDLGNKYSQISVAVPGKGEVETLSLVAGEESYNIPTVLCKRNGVSQWFYGREAIRYAGEEQGILVENLLELALDGEPVVIEGESFDPAALLALFFKRSLGMLSQAGSPDKLEALMITCEFFDRRLFEVLENVVARIRLVGVKITFQSHTESYYTYMLHQPEELWGRQSVLFHYKGSRIKAYCMECNRRTTPVAVFIGEREYPFPEWEGLPEDETGREQRSAELDNAFLPVAQEVCGDGAIGSVYLIGDGFSEEWMKNSLRYLCKGRRVFQGNNLFSKGACYGMQERLDASEAGKNHVFLGNDKLKANIGMKILRQGEEVYYALLDAGSSWYEAGYSTEAYIQDGNTVTLVITPLIGGGSRTEELVLEDFPGGTARIRLQLRMENEELLAVEVTDLGFGGFRSASGRAWRKEISLY